MVGNLLWHQLVTPAVSQMSHTGFRQPAKSKIPKKNCAKCQQKLRIFLQCASLKNARFIENFRLYAKRTGFGCSFLQFSPSFRLSENPIFRVFPWTAPRSLGTSAALSLRPNCARFVAPKSPFLLRKKKHLGFFSLKNFACSPWPAVFLANLRRFLWERPCAFWKRDDLLTITQLS